MHASARLHALHTILSREIRRIMRIWGQTLVPPAITMLLYFVIFGNLVGSRIGEMGGMRYIDYIVPGLIMMSVIQNSYGNIVSSFFGSKFGLWITLSTFVLTATVFALAGFINAVYAKKFDDISIVPTFVLTPLTYLGGVFYSVDLLPDFWEAVSHANPILYMVNAFRYGLLGTTDVDLRIAYAVMVGFTVVLAFVSLRLLTKGVGMRS